MISLVHFVFFLLILQNVLACLDGKGRILAFPSSLFFEGERLANPTIATIRVIDRDMCKFRCYLEHNCVSINYNVRPREPDTENCELNNSTSKEHQKDLIKAANYVYHGTNNACGNSPCKNEATCQSGFTTSRYRCLCPPGFTGHNCEHEKWIQMTPSTVCFGASDDSYGFFRTNQSGNIITFKLTYQSGYVTCDTRDPSHRSKWGSLCSRNIPNQMATVVTDTNRNILLPTNNYLVDFRGCKFYSLPWATTESPELLFDNFSTPLTAEANHEFQIWYSEDLFNWYEIDNGYGKTCVAVYGLYV